MNVLHNLRWEKIRAPMTPAYRPSPVTNRLQKTSRATPETNVASETPQNFKKQLSLIFDAMGSPQPHEVAHIKNPEAIRFLESMQGRVKV